MFLRMVLCAIICLFPTTSLLAQTDAYADDVDSIDSIIKAYYEVVSTPAGTPADRERDLAIHIPDAQVIIMADDGNGGMVANRMTISQYHDNLGGPRTVGFFEVEVHRETQQYGAMAHVWSTYEWRTKEDGPVEGQGINSIQLYHDGNRWWIAAEIYDTRNLPVPERYRPRN